MTVLTGSFHVLQTSISSARSSAVRVGDEGRPPVAALTAQAGRGGQMETATGGPPLHLCNPTHGQRGYPS